MPTYDYTCTACKKTVEIFHSMTEKPRTKCPSCGKNALERQLGTGGAIIFKGGGFYQTDYRSDSYKKAAAADSGTNSGSGGGAKDAGESKATPTETKAESKSGSKANAETKPSDAKPAKQATKEPAKDSSKKPSKSTKD